ncbi:MAG: TolC family protein, partial [Spirochaetota bacterium]|nr:TolC family protein [Spirochaetota bacterium]
MNQAINLSIKKNPDLKLVNLMIKKTELDIEQRFMDIKESELKAKHKKFSIMQLENQREDIIDSVYFDVQNRYYDGVINKNRYEKAKDNLMFMKNYLDENIKNYKMGKIDLISYKQIEEEYKQKKEDYILSRGDFKRAVLAFLLSINESLTISVNFTDSISQDTKSINFTTAESNLLNNNRNISLARLNYQIKKLEYNLLDKKIMSKNEIEKAKFDLDEAKIKLEQEIRKQKVELWSRYLLIKEQEAKLITIGKRLNRANTSYQLNESKYQQGYIPKHKLDQSSMEYNNLFILHLTVIKAYNLAKL